MQFHSLQPTFSGGVFSPSLCARVDLQKYGTGLKTGKNFIIHPSGGASNAPGTYMIAATKYADKKCGLIDFEYSIQQAFVIEIGHLYCRFYMNGAQVQLDGSPYEIVSPYSESDLESIKYIQSADVLFIVHPSYPPKRLVRYAATNWVFEDITMKNGPFMEANTDETKKLTASAETGTITLSSNVSLFNSLHIGSVWKFRTEIKKQAASGTLSGTNNSTSIKCAKDGTWRLSTGGLWTGDVKLQRSYDNSTWEDLRVWSLKDNNINTYGELNEKKHLYLRVSWTLTTGDGRFSLTSDPFYQDGIVKITAFTNDKSVTATVIDPIGRSAVGDTLETSDWAEGAWSSYRGFPSSVLFFQDRQVFASTAAEPQTTWMTRIGDYTDFGRSEPLKDDDGITVNLPSRKMNGIKNLVSFGKILALTSATEWSIGASGGVMTPTTVNQQCEGYCGCSNVEPVIIGNRCIYVQPMGKVIRDLGFEYSSDGFSGENLSIFADHLFKGKTVVDMAYQREPDSIVWVVLDDGSLLSMTYLKEHQVLAWTNHDTLGKYEKVCTIPGNGYNEVWFVVLRDGVRYIERQAQRMASILPEDQFFVHCGKTYSGAATTTITGLSHLNGKEVSVLADGCVVKGKTVSNGTLTLDSEASKVHVGLPYVSDLETLNVELGLSDGTSQARTKIISDVVIRFLDSRGGLLGPDSSNLDEVIQRPAEGFENVIQLFTGDYKQVLGSGYDEGGRVFFRQEDPLPVTILAIIPTVSMGG